MVREIKQDKRQNPSPSVNGQRGLYRETIFHHGPMIAAPCCSLLFISIRQQACPHKNPSHLPRSKHISCPRWEAFSPLCLALPASEYFSFSVFCLKPELSRATSCSSIELQCQAGCWALSEFISGAWREKKSEAAIDSDATLLWPTLESTRQPWPGPREGHPSQGAALSELGPLVSWAVLPEVWGMSPQFSARSPIALWYQESYYLVDSIFI